MGELQYSVWCRIKSDITEMALNISQPHIITNTTQLFNKNVKSLMKLYTPATPYKGILSNQ